MPIHQLPDASISAVERETGLSKDTLRVWERRYGFPLPRRDAHGERLYPQDQVHKLRLISRLLDRGLRPGQLVGAPLEALLARASDEDGMPPQGVRSEDGERLDTTLRLLAAYDEAALRSHLSLTLQRLGLQRFVIDFAAPMNLKVGEAWSLGQLSISQEHLYTEQMQHQLRQGIGAIYPGVRGPSVMLTTLPGEEHQLGLLMAQACLAVEGIRCVSLGVQTPAWDISEAARQKGVDVVGLSFSEALRQKTALEMLTDLRDRLPERIEIWAGGALWARLRRRLPGVRFITRLEQLPRVIAEYRAEHESPIANAG